MPRNNSLFLFFRKLSPARYSSFGREISLALLVKFLLLGGLWWAFFAGNKQPVDEWTVAGKIFGENRPNIYLQKSQERP